MKEITDKIQHHNDTLEYYLDILVNDETFKLNRHQSDVGKLLTLKALKDCSQAITDMRADVMDFVQIQLMLANLDKLHDICRDEMKKILG